MRTDVRHMQGSGREGGVPSEKWAECEKVGDSLATSSDDPESTPKVSSSILDIVIIHTSPPVPKRNGRGVWNHTDFISGSKSSLLWEDIKFSRHVIFYIRLVDLRLHVSPRVL